MEGGEWIRATWSNYGSNPAAMLGGRLMFKVLILVCSMALAPEDCQTDSDVSVINGPDGPNALMCGLNGQAYVASTALAHTTPHETTKVRSPPATTGPTGGSPALRAEERRVG